MEEDWRLSGREAQLKKYLYGITLYKRKYKRYSETWDHDHCELCMEKFAETDLIPEALHEGYATLDNYRWICASCFNDFREKFAWTLAELEE